MKILVLIADTLRELSGKAMLIILISVSTLFLLGSLLAFSARRRRRGSSSRSSGGRRARPSRPTRSRCLWTGSSRGSSRALDRGGPFRRLRHGGRRPGASGEGRRGPLPLKTALPLELLGGKYLGAVAAVFICALYFIGALFLVFGLRAGVWNVNLLLAMLGVLLVFAAIHAIVVFIGVLSGSTALSILGAYFYLFVLANVLNGREATLYIFSSNEIFRSSVDGLYYLFPQIPGMRDEIVKFVGRGEARWEPFVQSAASGLAILFGAALIFRRRTFRRSSAARDLLVGFMQA